MAAERATPPLSPAQTASTMPEKSKFRLKVRDLADIRKGPASDKEIAQDSAIPVNPVLSDDAEIYSPNALPPSLRRQAMSVGRLDMVSGEAAVEDSTVTSTPAIPKRPKTYSPLLPSLRLPAVSRQGMAKPDKTKANGRVKKRNKVKINHRRIVVESESSDAAPEHPAEEQAGHDQPTSTPPDSKSTSPLAHIATSLATFPTGEVACGRGLEFLPMPEIELLNHGVIMEPYDQDQLQAVKDFARELRAKRYGVDWKAVKRTPTWTIPGSVVEVKHRYWEDILAEYAQEAGRYLGFGKQKLTTRLQNLHLWEKGSMWRDFHNEYYDPTRVGTLLIIFKRSCCKGGEIAVGCGDKEMFFDPASSKHHYFFIASHNHAKHDTLPLTAGYRLGLAYDLRLDTHDGKPLVYDILERVADAENQLFYHITCWAEEIELGKRANHPLLFVLDTTYEHCRMHMEYLTAEDRAKALAVGNVAREVYGEKEKFKLRGYLVSVTGKTKISGTKSGEGCGRRVTYAINGATGLDGMVMKDMEGAVVEERSVLQPGQFERGVSRKLDGKTSEIIRSRTCIMLVLEKKEDQKKEEEEEETGETK